jgi:hypothetical protein
VREKVRVQLSNLYSQSMDQLLFWITDASCAIVLVMTYKLLNIRNINPTQVLLMVI